MHGVVRGRKNPLYHDLPERLRRVRRQRQLAMSAASLDAALTNDFAFHIEKRRRLPRVDTIERLAMSLGVSPAWLTYGEGEEARQHSEPRATDIAQRLRDARLRSGMSRAGLGRAAELTGQTIANIEEGGMVPKIDTVELLAKALSISPSWLAFGMDEAASVRNEFVTNA